MVDLNVNMLTNNEANLLFKETKRYPFMYDDEAKTMFDLLQGLMRAIAINHEDDDIDKIIRHSCIGINAPQEYDYGLLFCHKSSADFKVYNGYETLPSVINNYLSKEIKTCVYINRETEGVIVHLHNIPTAKWMRSFMSVLPRILIWYYPDKLNEQDREFFASLSNDNYKDILIDYINSTARKFNVKFRAVQNLIQGKCNMLKHDLVREAEIHIKNKQSEFDNLKNKIANVYEEIEKARYTLSSLIMSKDISSDDYVDFFCSHTNIFLKQSSSRSLIFDIIETIDFYDEELIADMCDDKQSYLFEYTLAHQEVLDLMKLIFVKHKGRFVTYATFALSSFKYVAATTNQCLDNKKYMPHPHIMMFGCDGGNSFYYDKYATEGNWELAIEQAISATKNINFSDAVVLRRTIDWIISNWETVKFIRITEEEDLLTPAEFMNVVKEKEVTNG